MVFEIIGQSLKLLILEITSVSSVPLQTSPLIGLEFKDLQSSQWIAFQHTIYL